VSFYRLLKVVVAAGLLSCTVASADDARVYPKLVMALKQAVRETTGSSNQLKALTWLADMSTRLEYRIPDPFYRVQLLKTGHTESAGYCLVTSAKKEGMRLITVVLGTDSANARADASQALLNYGFRFFETHKLYDAGTQLTTSRIWKGSSEAIALGLDHALFVTIPRGQYNSLDASMNIDQRIMAPVTTGQALGTVQVMLGEQLVAKQPLVSLQTIGEGSFWQRISDEALLYLE